MDNQSKQFDSVEYSVMAVVLCDGKILATVEDIYGKQVLSLPKGHQELNEALLDTAIRECFEETNVVISQNDFVKELNSYSYQFSTPSNKLVQKIITPFLFRLPNEGNPIAKEERIISVQWMKIDDFLSQCTYENVKQIVRSIY